MNILHYIHITNKIEYIRIAIGYLINKSQPVYYNL